MGDNWAWLEQRQMFSLGRIFVPTLVKSNPISVSLSLHGSGETAHTISVWEGRSGRERDGKKYFHQKIWVTGNGGSIWVAYAKCLSLKAVCYAHIHVHIYAGGHFSAVWEMQLYTRIFTVSLNMSNSPLSSVKVWMWNIFQIQSMTALINDRVVYLGVSLKTRQKDLECKVQSINCLKIKGKLEDLYVVLCIG